jgi:hypothetical protein
MKDSQETTTLIQGILVWLIFAFICAAIWFGSITVIYFLQSEKTALPLRFVWAATAATAIVGVFIGSAKLYRARRG